MSCRGWKTTCTHSLAISHGRLSLGRNKPSRGWPPGALTQVHRGLPGPPPQSPGEKAEKKGCAPGPRAQGRTALELTGPGLSLERLPCPAHGHTVPAHPGTDNTERATNRALAKSPSTKDRDSGSGQPGNTSPPQLRPHVGPPRHGPGACTAQQGHPLQLHAPPLTRCFQHNPPLRPGCNHVGHQSPNPRGLPAVKGPSVRHGLWLPSSPRPSTLILGPGGCCRGWGWGSQITGGFPTRSIVPRVLK